MIYIYDTVIGPNETKLKRYGGKYTLENRTRMGDQFFYTFACSGRESLLVVPRFAEQYREMEKFCRRYGNSKKLETCRGHIFREINKHFELDEVPNDDSETGTMTLISVRYKDIQVEFQYMNHRMTLSPEFEIVSSNIFGNGIVVLMNLNMEE